MALFRWRSIGQLDPQHHGSMVSITIRITQIVQRDQLIRLPSIGIVPGAEVSSFILSAVGAIERWQEQL